MDILQKSKMLEAMWVAFKWPLICYGVYFILKLTLRPLFSAIARALFK
jgi:hypothetical protein